MAEARLFGEFPMRANRFPFLRARFLSVRGGPILAADDRRVVGYSGGRKRYETHWKEEA
jgi:hypothetical protein